MGFSFRRSKTIGGIRFNASQRRLTESTKLGPFRISSTGRTSIRLGKGLSFRFPTKRR